MTRYLQPGFIFCLLFPGAHASFAAAAYQYTVSVPQDLSRLAVKLCFNSTPPSHLFLPDATQASQVEDIYLITASGETRLTPADDELVLSGVKSGDCLGYTLNFNGAITHPWFRHTESTHDQIQINLNQWLLQPAEIDGSPFPVTFHVAQGFSVSAPGKLLSAAAGSWTYEFKQTETSADGQIAIGRFPLLRQQLKGTHIGIALLQGKQAYDPHKILQWVQTNLAAFQQLYGRLPVPDLQVLVVPVGSNREVVPWGEVERGGGDAVQVYVDETRPLAELLSDWVLIHELSHLLHPHISGSGIWLAEGLASYYQNVLRARAGLLSAQAAWEKLDAGFARGRRGTPVDQTLAQVAETMPKNRLYMRVYWSGAAISLIADTQLRQATGNKQSLDTVLSQFAECCLATRQRWTAQALLQKFDALSATRIFSDLYNKYAESVQFPDLAETYRVLGLQHDGKQLELTATAPALAVRQAIMHTRQ